MGTVQKLAEKVKEGLQTALPKLRKTVVSGRRVYRSYAKHDCTGPSSLRAANYGCGGC